VLRIPHLAAPPPLPHRPDFLHHDAGKEGEFKFYATSASTLGLATGVGAGITPAFLRRTKTRRPGDVSLDSACIPRLRRFTLACPFLLEARHPLLVVSLRSVPLLLLHPGLPPFPLPRLQSTSSKRSTC